ncbi:uncharacterized protein LOC123705352 [Colias croceus]|uniref:uncharacterized protein LOC123705352 n=1 Tax=Colias crocea TaxID=72248 RepID=UPI001E27A318|nr:uncharacterized protein LOC123705352 [Colias croceus]
MRVGGRLNNSFYDFDTKHPILLSSKHHLAELIFRQYHIWLMHAGPQLLLATLRHKFWVIGGRNLARKTVQRCIKCCRFSGRIIQPIMGNLPEQRLHAEFPFTNTAVDYAGPVMILNRKGRGSRTMKSYLCIFVCLAVKAVHIELVTDLSNNSARIIISENNYCQLQKKAINKNRSKHQQQEAPSFWLNQLKTTRRKIKILQSNLLRSQRRNQNLQS